MGNRIEALRKKTNLSRRKLGLKTNIPEASLRRYEAGETEPKIETWEKLANFFGVSTGYLMGLSDSPKRAFIDPVAIALDDRKLFERMVDTTSQWDGSDYSELVPSAVKEKIGKNLKWFSYSYEALIQHYDTGDKKNKSEPGIERLLDLELDIIENLSDFHRKMDNELRSGAKLDSSLEYVLEFIAGFLEREYR